LVHPRSIVQAPHCAKHFRACARWRRPGVLRSAARDLHRDRARAAQARAAESPDGGAREGPDVHAAVIEEAPILGGDHGGNQGGGDPIERRPVQAAPAGIDPALLNHLAVTIQEPRLRGAPGRAHLAEVGIGVGRADLEPEDA
jgi:hypothetical protein